MTATDIGYDNPPTSAVLDGVTVSYKIKTPLGTGQTFKVTVTLTKGAGTTVETATKEITITAAYDFTTVKSQFPATFTSSKTKADLVGKTIGTVVTATDIGYDNPPTSAVLDGVTVSYKIKTPLGTGQTFKVTVTLTKGAGTTVETATKEITITAAYDFTNVKSQFPATFTSSKTRADLDGKTIGTVVTATDIGYDNPPTSAVLDGVTVSYKIKTPLGTGQTFKVTVTLTKGAGTTVETATKEITITVATV